ncbi:hypothetical protein ACQ5SO_00620 [Rhodovulum sp. DZ06]|uniref:hypothetical protein n=1 Tax=Rhodovulum sp. DZ06 TaxID=3425126 RepID=UPI003D33F784
MNAPLSPLAPLSELRVHLGAHKTASTHLQMTLYDARDALLAQGIDAIPQRDLRRAVGPLMDPRKPGGRRMGRALGAACLGALAPARRGPGRLVLTEENLIGTSQWPLRRPPYWTAPFFLRPVRALSRIAAQGGGETHLFLAIRSFDEMLPAAYAQRLRLRPWPESFEAVAARALARPPSWLPLVRLIRLTLPRATLSIWRHDDYRANSHAIREAICGAPLPRLPEPENPFGTRTPSAEAVAWAEALPKDLDLYGRKVQTGERFRASVEAGEPRWDPFSADQKARLRARFDADVAAIEGKGLARLLRFNGGAAS